MFYFIRFSVGVFKNGVGIIADYEKNQPTPSYIALTAGGGHFNQDAAKNQQTTNSENTAFSARQLNSHDRNGATVLQSIIFFPLVNKNLKPHLQVQTNQGEKSLAAEEISELVLMKMKETAEAYLGKKVTHVIIAVPDVSFAINIFCFD